MRNTKKDVTRRLFLNLMFYFPKKASARYVVQCLKPTKAHTENCSHTNICILILFRKKSSFIVCLHDFEYLMVKLEEFSSISLSQKCLLALNFFDVFARTIFFVIFAS